MKMNRIIAGATYGFVGGFLGSTYIWKRSEHEYIQLPTVQQTRPQYIHSLYMIGLGLVWPLSYPYYLYTDLEIRRYIASFNEDEREKKD